MSISNLLQESRQLNAKLRAGSSKGHLPQLKVNLTHLEELSNQLAAKVSTVTEAQKTRGQMMLAAKGLNISKIEEDLKRANEAITLDNAGTPRTLSANIIEDNVDDFLNNEIDALVVKSLERQEGLIAERANAILEERRQEKWNRLQNDLLESKLAHNINFIPFATDAGKQDPNRQRTALKKRVVKAPLRPAQMQTFSKIICKYNEKRLAGAKTSFSSLVTDEIRAVKGDLHSELLFDCWKLIESVTAAGDPFKSDTGEIGANLIVERGRGFLERLFMQHIDQTLAMYPRDAMLGGRPSALDRIRTYCEIKLKRLSANEIASIELFNGNAVWMIIYHLVRCGFESEALEYAEHYRNMIGKSESKFIHYLQSWIKGETGVLQSEIQSEYAERLLRPHQDSYKMTLLKIFGHCDLAHKSTLVLLTSQDYIWLQFHLISTFSQQKELYSLGDLQKIICQFGPAHFDPKDDEPLLYVQCLLLVGLFGKAIEYLFSRGCKSDAIYFCIALLEAKLLPISAAIKDPLFSGGKVNFARLLINWAGEQDSVEVSLNLLMLLSLATHQINVDKSVIEGAICDLIVSSGDYSLLLGDVEAGEEAGILYKFAPILSEFSVDITSIVGDAALKCQNNMRIRDALQLFNICGKYSKVLSLLAHQLGKKLSNSWDQSEAEYLLKTARSIVDYYSGKPEIAFSVRKELEESSLLISLVKMREMHEGGRLKEAFDALCKVPFLPLQSSDPAEIARAAENANSLSSSIICEFSDILLMSMKILCATYKSMATLNVGVDAGRRHLAVQIKKMARNLMSFVGFLRLRLPQHLFTQLTVMEISLN